MKTVRIVYNHFAPDGNTLAYQDVECTSWEVIGNLLVLYKKGANSFVPLVQIHSFQELQQD